MIIIYHSEVRGQVCTAEHCNTAGWLLLQIRKIIALSKSPAFLPHQDAMQPSENCQSQKRQCLKATIKLKNKLLHITVLFSLEKFSQLMTVMINLVT